MNESANLSTDFVSAAASLPAHLRVDGDQEISKAFDAKNDNALDSYPFSKINPFVNGDLVEISLASPTDSILALEAMIQESPNHNSESWYKLGIKHQGKSPTMTEYLNTRERERANGYNCFAEFCATRFQISRRLVGLGC